MTYNKVQVREKVQDLSQKYDKVVDAIFAHEAQKTVEVLKDVKKVQKQILHNLTRSEIEAIDVESFKDRYDYDVKCANDLLRKGGFTNYWEFITKAHAKGIQLSNATLSDLYDEFVDSHRDDMVENETNDLIAEDGSAWC